MAEVTYYWDSFDFSDWTSPALMVDGIITNYAYTAGNGDFHRLDGTTCPGTDLGAITKVEIRVYGYGDGDDRIDITPHLPFAGNVHEFTMPSSSAWSSYEDITTDPNAPAPWTWPFLQGGAGSFELFLYKTNVGKGNTVYCSKVEIRVTYTPSGAALEKVLTDSFAIAEAITKEPGLVKTESSAITDSPVLVADFVRSIADTVAIADSPSKGVAFPSLAESIGIVDSVSKEPGIILADSVTIAEGLVKAPGLFRADSLGIADSFAKAAALSRTFADTVVLADDLTRSIGIYQADTLTIAHVLVKLMGLPLADAVALADALLVDLTPGGAALSLILADSLAITDTLTRQANYSRALADTVNISDSITDVVEFFLTMADSIAIAEAVSKGVGQLQSDSLAIADAISKSVGLNKADSLAMSELLQMFRDTVYTARLHYWTGSAWNKALFKRWTGSDWEIIDTSNVV